jgi:hypothetical protein
VNVNGIPPAFARLAATTAAAPQRVREARELEPKSAAELVADAGGLDAVDVSSEAIRPAALRSASLWEMLSPEERAFFSDPATLGSLTYRPGGRTAATAPARTGQRVDFKA